MGDRQSNLNDYLTDLARRVRLVSQIRSDAYGILDEGDAEILTLIADKLEEDRRSGVISIRPLWISRKQA